MANPRTTGNNVKAYVNKLTGHLIVPAEELTAVKRMVNAEALVVTIERAFRADGTQWSVIFIAKQDQAKAKTAFNRWVRAGRGRKVEVDKKSIGRKG